MSSDISSSEDIRTLVLSFYKKATVDPVIGHFFTQVMQLDWDHHIPRICSFWESILLGNHAFQGNPMLKHIELNAKSKMEQIHFDRWNELWKQTVLKLYSGPKANEAISRAEQIGQLMMYKIDKAN